VRVTRLVTGTKKASRARVHPRYLVIIRIVIYIYILVRTPKRLILMC
jgi:hypothetical protein